MKITWEKEKSDSDFSLSHNGLNIFRKNSLFEPVLRHCLQMLRQWQSLIIVCLVKSVLV